jgi:hypothetical protein
VNKQKKLKQSIIKQGIISAVILALAGGAYLFTSSMVDNSLPQKNNAEGALQNDRSEISSLSAQLEKSGVAETRFLEITKERKNLDFSPNREALKEFLRSAKERYRLSSSFKLTLTTEKLLENKSGTQSNYVVYEYPDMRIEFDAMSDTHVFSFLDDLMQNAPGIISIEHIALTRIGDIDKTSIAQIATGATPHTIGTIIHFRWLGLKEKEKKDEQKTGGKP